MGLAWGVVAFILGRKDSLFLVLGLAPGFEACGYISEIIKMLLGLS